MKRVSVVSPVYDESGVVLINLVESLMAMLGDQLQEIIFVYSPATPEACRSILYKLQASDIKVGIICQQHPGYGGAVRDGIDWATGDLTLMIDSDGEMRIEDVPKLLQCLDVTGADLVIASRWMKGGGTKGYGKFKYILNRGFQQIFRVLYATDLHDLTLGYKLGKTSELKKMQLTSKDQEVCTEITLKALKAGLKVKEIPTVWTARKTGASTNPLSRNWKYAKVAMNILFM